MAYPSAMHAMHLLKSATVLLGMSVWVLASLALGDMREHVAAVRLHAHACHAAVLLFVAALNT
jgi:hypothetical protein